MYDSTSSQLRLIACNLAFKFISDNLYIRFLNFDHIQYRFVERNEENGNPLDLSS